MFPENRISAPEPPKPGAAAHRPAPTSINADEPWRATPPSRRPCAPVKLPMPQSFQLANGLTVIALPRRPACRSYRRALSCETAATPIPLDKPGLASFTAAMLDQGTATRSATQLADDVAQIGASLTSSSSMDAMTITTSSLTKNFPAALTLLADVVAESGVSRPKKSSGSAGFAPPSSCSSAAIRCRSQQRRLAAALYGARASVRVLARLVPPMSIKHVTRDELQAFWRRHFVPDNAALIVAGSIALPECARLRSPRLAAGRAAGDRPKLGDSALGQPRLVLVDRPGFAADAITCRDDRRAAIEPRLHAAACDERDSWRSVLEPDQHEFARSEWLHLWREIAVLLLA